MKEILFQSTYINQVAVLEIVCVLHIVRIKVVVASLWIKFEVHPRVVVQDLRLVIFLSYRQEISFLIHSGATRGHRQVLSGLFALLLSHNTLCMFREVGELTRTHLLLDQCGFVRQVDARRALSLCDV